MDNTKLERIRPFELIGGKSVGSLKASDVSHPGWACIPEMLVFSTVSLNTIEMARAAKCHFIGKKSNSIW